MGKAPSVHMRSEYLFATMPALRRRSHSGVGIKKSRHGNILPFFQERPIRGWLSPAFCHDECMITRGVHLVHVRFSDGYGVPSRESEVPLS